MRHLLGFLLAFVVTIAAADWTSTRTTAYDWQCQNADGTKISDHTRQDTAFVSCSNLTLKDSKTRKVVGGSYTIAATSSSSSSSSSAATASITLNWTVPTKNTDGSALTDLTGYMIYYGTAPDNLSSSVPVGLVTAYTVPGLAVGRTWYFVIASVSTSGGEGSKSNAASKAI